MFVRMTSERPLNGNVELPSLKGRGGWLRISYPDIIQKAAVLASGGYL